jgi:hypothetical protein
MTTEKITVGEALSWWAKNKTKVFALIALLGGLIGGANSGTIGGLVPSNPEVSAQLNDHENRIKALEEDNKSLVGVIKEVLKGKVEGSDTIKVD